jgi:hypothetical protein
LSFSDESAWTETNVTIENPSKYSFNVGLLQQKLYLNSLDDFGYIFTAYLSNPIILRPISNYNATFKIIVPNHKMNIIASVTNRNWLAAFYISVESLIFDRLTLSFFRQIS